MAQTSQNAQPQQQLPKLSEILTPQNLVPLMEDEAVKARLGELVEHLPAEHQADAQKQVSNPGDEAAMIINRTLCVKR